MNKSKQLLLLLLILILVFVLTNAPFAQHFTPVNPTGIAQPVVIQNATINGVPIMPGDELAVFDGTLCVGAATYNGTFPVTITVWLEYQPPGEPVKPGGKAGNSMSFKTWQQSSNTELDATPNYSVGAGIFGEPLTVVSLIEAVPVELSLFTAEVISNSIKLVWSTQTETNNYGFGIERSKDGMCFFQIGFVNGEGTTTIPRRYSFIDSNLSLATYYYRLKQVDSDGSFCYSDVLEVKVKAPAVFFLSQNYPNPFNHETRITYQLPEPVFVTLKIHNSLGQEIIILVHKVMGAGNHSVMWDARDTKGEVVPGGIYYYKIQAGDFVETRKLVLLK